MKHSMIAMAVSGALCSAVSNDRSSGGGAVKSALSPDKIAKGQDKAEANNASAGFSPEGYGKEMATGYLKAIAGVTVTWQEGVLHLLKTCNDVQQEKAMTAALKVAEDEQDESAANNLKKRISEARRVFRASREDYSKTLKHMQAKGSWHQKVTTLPKASTKGRKAGNGAGKTTTPQVNAKTIQAEASKIIGKDAQPAQLAKVVQLVTKAAQSAAKEATKEAQATATKVSERHAKPDLGMVVDTIKRMSAQDQRKVLDVVLFHLSQGADKATATAAKEAMKAFDAIDNKPEARKEVAAA